MAIALKRQLSEHEKEIIIERVGRIDWVTGRVSPEAEHCISIISGASLNLAGRASC
jgi:hypothetical protein